eukprot:4289280-Pleurochrysis_carterae.AAC.1
MIDKKLLANESRVIEETVRLVKMAHATVPVSAAYKGTRRPSQRRRRGAKWRTPARQRTDLEAEP